MVGESKCRNIVISIGKWGEPARAVFAFLARSLQQASTFIITLLAAGFLSPAEYGVYTLGIVFIALCQTLTYTGFYHFIVTSSEVDEFMLFSTTFWLVIGLAGCSTILLMVGSYPISILYDSAELASVLLLLAVVQPFAGASAWFSAILLRQKKLTEHFLIIFIQNLVSLVGGVVLLLLWKSVYALVAFRYLRVVTGFILYLVVCKERPGMKFNAALSRSAVNYSGGLYGSRFLNFLGRYSGGLVLGVLFTTAEAGLYRFGSRVVGGAVGVVGQPMSSFALTQLGAAGRHGRDLAEPIEHFVGAILLLTGIVASVIFVFADDVIAVFFKPAYMAALIVTYALCVRAVLQACSLVLEPVLAAKNFTGTLFFFNAFWTIASILAVFFTAQFGLSVLAWSQAGVALLASISAILLIKHKANIKIGGVVRVFLLAALLVICYMFLAKIGWGFISEVLTFSNEIELFVGIICSFFLGLGILVIGRCIGVFKLSVFSG